MNSDFNLIYRGEVALDHDILVTREKFAKIFKASDDKIELLFSGNPVVLKKGLSAEDGIKWQRHMLQMGAITYLEESKVQDSVRSKAPTQANSNTRGRINKSTIIEPTSRRAISQAPSLSLQPLDEKLDSVDTEDDDPEGEPELGKKRFNLPHITFSLSISINLTLILLGLLCIIAFSPYPDWVVRKGLVIGAIIIFVGVRRLMR